MSGKQLDFTSSLYLDYRHSSAEIGSWNQYTMGAPAAVRPWPQAAALTHRLKQLCGIDDILLGRSTLHLFWDLFGLSDWRERSVLIDEYSYPVARWAVMRLAGSNAQVQEFPHLAVDDLERLCRQSKRQRRRPLILTDSFCCACGGMASLGAYCDLARQHDGEVIVDDTQGIGLFGASPTAALPFGIGGGGCFPYHKLAKEPMVVISSLAKAFGCPVAYAAGPGDIVSRLRHEGDSQIHCSQPSAADLASLEHALTLNARNGDERRAMLFALIGTFRAEAQRLGLESVKSVHPTQSLFLRGPQSPLEFQRLLKARGVVCLIGKGHRDEARLVFLLTVRHTADGIRYALTAVADLLMRSRRTVGSSRALTARKIMGRS